MPVIRPLILFALAASLMLAAPSVTRAQELTEDMVGQNDKAWEAWNALIRAVERGEMDAAATVVDSITAFNLSELRLALMADRTPGTLRFEQWAEREDAPAPAKAILEKLKTGRRQQMLAEDGLHMAVVGRFNYADANFKALIESNADPVALVELIRQNPNRQDTLLKLINNTEVGESAKGFLKLLAEGEELLRKDPYEIVTNINKLAGPPRMAYNATNRLKASGEYAIPHLIQALQDSGRSRLHPAIMQVIPQIGRDALNPLVQALGMGDDVVKGIIIRSLSKIGYKQAVPYLAKLANDSKAGAEVRSAAEQALASLGAGGSNEPGPLFYELGDLYYEGSESLQADPRSDDANVWYLRENSLRYVAVPRAIFADIMAMRCSEEALILQQGLDDAIALWLAANYRRESKLGLDVESDQPDPLANKDSTRTEDYPRSIYFGRAAGAKYNHMVLGRAYERREVGVALGAISALRDTAGEPGLVGSEDIKQPLVLSLSFPSRQVRIKAALALAAALPKAPFSGADNVVAVLTEALMQSGRQSALVVESDEGLRNKLQALLRAGGYETAVGANLYEAMEAGRGANLTAFDLILLGSDVAQPDAPTAIAELRKAFESAATPILLVAREGEVGRAARVARDSQGVEVLDAIVVDLGDPEKIKEQVEARINRASQTLGMTMLDRDMSLDLAIQSAKALRLISESNLEIYDASRATNAFIGALSHASQVLRVESAKALALIAAPEGQEALAEYALDGGREQPERITAFGSLAEAARRNGNLLGDREVVARLIEFTLTENDLVLRAAASKALGALDLESNKAGEIIRSQHNG
ncbi:MAG TPA: HEAT repeat domain-containing protein [Phycisphaerae bacterium]|nr:HEAT repeat domain-containing protein [Phycisphaerae bacterium]